VNTELNSPRRGFASDNSASVHPAVLTAIAGANHGHAFGYGHDPYTHAVEQRVAEAFGVPVAADVAAAGGPPTDSVPGARTLFVFNGSGANVLCLRASCRPWEAVICTESAHINTDEGGAAEAIAGVKLLTVRTADGKLTPELAQAQIQRIGDEHAVQPRVISITQSTELGTVYTLAETAALAELAHANDLLLHVDGARLANAAAALGVSLRALTTDVGADLVSFGGTKNGILLGEAVVVLNPALAPGFEYLRKQTLQLASKMRFLAAQFDALLHEDLWQRNAAHANAMATRLAEAVTAIDGVTLTRPVQANAVFALLPQAASIALLEDFDFYLWDEATGEARWMCAWDTTPEDIDEFAAAVESAVRATRV
jgi:threonine aldolase